jgi:hypothetical protein
MSEPAVVHAREVVLVEQDIIVCGLAGAEYPLMATQIKVPLDGARHGSVNDRPRRTVRVARCLATFGDGGLGEKDEFVHFADNNERDGRVEVQLRAGTWRWV